MTTEVRAIPNLVELNANGDADQGEARLREALDAHGLQLFARIDHAAGAHQADVELKPDVLLIFTRSSVRAGRCAAVLHDQRDGGVGVAGGGVRVAAEGEAWIGVAE
jgi:hypothetical protein